MRPFVALLAALILSSLAPPAAAEPRVTLGWGRMFTNDGIGDGEDRWRTGAYTISRVRGPSWSGALPPTFGEILEFRLRAEIIAPDNLLAHRPGDRRYAGLLTLGMHTHFALGGFDTSLGAEVAVTGPQSGIGELQSGLHRLLGLDRPRVLGNQIPNGFHPTLVAELGRDLPLGPGRLRPFLEVQAGLETFVRAGADLSFGRYGEGALMLREATTGQRYRAVPGDFAQGLSFSLGGDMARVFDSQLLPEGGPAAEEERSRLRAGLAWQNARGASAFYGLTWLSEEFVGQAEGQLVGSLNFNFEF